MTLLLIGVIGALLMGLISKLFYTAAAARRGLSTAEKPFGGAVPAWVSHRLSGFLWLRQIYGVIKIIF